MPLIPQQEIVKVSGLTETIDETLRKELEKYPPVRIVSTSVVWGSNHSCILLAVVETI